MHLDPHELTMITRDRHFDEIKGIIISLRENIILWILLDE